MFMTVACLHIRISMGLHSSAPGGVAGTADNTYLLATRLQVNLPL